jgi:glycerol-3-phosphate dehydrogenase
MTGSARLDPANRAETLRQMSEETFDILVIGGGVTGAGVALDAATRGLRVALVEARDLAAGTSSRSSKLIHGGLRYLEQLNGALVREALRERSLLLETLAPHLVRPVPFLLPLTHHGWERAYIGSGVLLYDTLGQGLARIGPGSTPHAGSLPMHRHLTRKAALREFPSLRSDALVGAIQYWDGQVDDARHTMFVARTAARYGALVATSTQVVGLLRESDRVTGVRVRDLEAPGADGTAEANGAAASNGAAPSNGAAGAGRRGAEPRGDGGRGADDSDGGDSAADDSDGRGDLHAHLEIRAHETINATGVWTDRIHSMLGGRGGPLSVRASKGVHLVVPRDRLQGATGLILRTERSVLFVIPWGRHWIIGTTDTDWDLDLAHPAATAADIDYLLDQLNRVLRSPISRADVVGVYAGLRPLLAGESEDTAQLSREHAVVTAAPGLTTVAGGKYTTYRVMAADAVDAAVTGLTRTVPPSITDKVPLLGADGFAAVWNCRDRLANRVGLHVSRIEHLLRRYGTLVEELVDLIAADPALGAPLPGAESYLAVEAVYAASHEGALHLEDVLVRRTRISIETPDRGLGAARPTAELIAPVLGWDDAAIGREVDLYRARVAAELASQQALDDPAADTARRDAPDARRLPSARATTRTPAAGSGPAEPPAATSPAGAGAEAPTSSASGSGASAGSGAGTVPGAGVVAGAGLGAGTGTPTSRGNLAS